MALKTKTWFRIHSFTGVITGLLLFFICWTGTFAVISHELDWLVNSALQLEPQTEKGSWGEMEEVVKKEFPEIEIDYLKKQEYAYSPYVAYAYFPDQSYRAIYINPYTLKVIYTDYGFDIAVFFRNLHYNLFAIGNEHIGSYLVMFFGLVLFTSFLSALFLYKRWWTKFFQFKPGKQGRAFWTQVHKLAGVWSLWFLFLIALTGSYYLYEKFQWDTGLLGPQKLNYVGDENFGVVGIPEPESDTSQAFLPLDSLIQISEEKWPDLDIHAIFFTWPQEDQGSVSLQGHAGSLLSKAFIRERGNQINLDRRTGEVLLKSSTSDLSPYWIASNAADPLHFGYFGGLTSKIIWFVFGLVLCGMILSGTYLHIKKLHQKNGQARHGWRGTWWAIGITLCILIATVPYGFESARWYGPVVDGVRLLPDLYIGVKRFIIAWTLLTIAMILAWVLMFRKSTKLPKGFGYNNNRPTATGVSVHPTSQTEKKQPH
jgi:uncharacterized iron-regulated membrane protein